MKIQNITPKEMKCIIGGCPSIYKTDRDTYILIGRKINLESVPEILRRKVASGEEVIEVPIGLLRNIPNILKI